MTSQSEQTVYLCAECGDAYPWLNPGRTYADQMREAKKAQLGGWRTVVAEESAGNSSTEDSTGKSRGSPEGSTGKSRGSAGGSAGSDSTEDSTRNPAEAEAAVPLIEEGANDSPQIRYKRVCVQCESARRTGLPIPPGEPHDWAPLDIERRDVKWGNEGHTWAAHNKHDKAANGQ